MGQPPGGVLGIETGPGAIITAGAGGVIGGTGGGLAGGIGGLFTCMSGGGGGGGSGSRGSTGRTTPANAKEADAMAKVKANPGGRQIPVKMTDPKWPGSQGWVKMAQNEDGVEIHYVKNLNTGAVDDFKFK